MMANESGSFWDGQSGNSTSSGSTGSPFGSSGSTPSPAASSSSATIRSAAQEVHLSPISISIGLIASYTYCWLSYLFIRQFGLRQIAEQSEFDAAYSQLFGLLNHSMGLEILFGGTVVLLLFLLVYLSVLSLHLMYTGMSKLLCYLLTLTVVGLISSWFLFLRVQPQALGEPQRMWNNFTVIMFVSAIWTLVMLLACFCARLAEKSTHIWSAVIFWVFEAVFMVSYVFVFSILPLGLL